MQSYRRGEWQNIKKKKKSVKKYKNGALVQDDG